MRRQAWTTHWVTDPKTAGPSWPARDVLAKMAEGAWFCGDPGVQYDTTINRWHTCPNSGRINACNPCSEYMFLDDTACNLASINLMKFRQADGTFDVERFQAACRHLLHRSGDSGRSRQLSDASGSPRTATVPPAGSGLLEPGQPDHVERRGLRFATPPAGCAAR